MNSTFSSGLNFLIALLLAGSPNAEGARDPAQQQALPQPATAHSPLMLPDGTPVSLGICGEANSGMVSVDEVLDFRVREQVSVDDVVIVPVRAHAWGTVTDVKPPGKFLRDGEMTIRIDSVRLATGETAPLRTVRKFQGANLGVRTAEEVVGVALMSFVIPVANLGLLFQTGQNLKVTEKSRLTAYINGTISLRREDLQTATPGDAAWVVTQKSSANSIRIESEPSCAEIEIDGHYVDLSPSLLQLPPGRHSLTMRRAGYKPFEMKLVSPMSAGKITASLDVEVKE